MATNPLGRRNHATSEQPDFGSVATQGQGAATALRVLVKALEEIRQKNNIFSAYITGAKQAEDNTKRLTETFKEMSSVQSHANRFLRDANKALKEHAAELAREKTEIAKVMEEERRRQRAIIEASKNHVKITDEISRALSGVISAGLRAGITFAIIDRSLSAIQQHVGRFVQLANPGVYNLFSIAVKDLQASIGRALVPLLVRATGLIRAVADTFFNLSGEGQRLIQALAAGAVSMITFAGALALVEAVATGGLAPILTLIAGSITGVIASSSELSGVFDTVREVLGGVLDGLGKGISLVLAAFKPLLPLFQTIVSNSFIVHRAILTFATSFLSTIGGTIMSIVNNVLPILQAASPIINQFSKVLNELVTIGASNAGTIVGLLVDLFLTPTEMLADALKMAAPYLLAFAKIVAEVASSVTAAIRRLFESLGLVQKKSLFEGIGKKDTKPGSSTGAAATSTSTGDVMAALQRARESAFGLGAGGGAKKPEERTALGVESLSAKVDEIVAWVKGAPEAFWNAFKQLPSEIGKAITNTGKEAASGLAKAATSPMGVGALTAVNPILGAAVGIGSKLDIGKMVGTAKRELADMFSNTFGV